MRHGLRNTELVALRIADWSPAKKVVCQLLPFPLCCKMLQMFFGRFHKAATFPGEGFVQGSPASFLWVGQCRGLLNIGPARILHSLSEAEVAYRSFASPVTLEFVTFWLEGRLQWWVPVNIVVSFYRFLFSHPASFLQTFDLKTTKILRCEAFWKFEWSHLNNFASGTTLHYTPAWVVKRSSKRCTWALSAFQAGQWEYQNGNDHRSPTVHETATQLQGSSKGLQVSLNFH